MKTLVCPAILTSASTRADGSLSLRFSTPELSPEEKTAFFEALNCNLKMLLQPEGDAPAELKDIKGEFDAKTPSRRLRDCLWIWWKQQGELGEFDDFYRKKMSALIDGVKNNLKPV